jgi:hypothetical protein
MESEMKKFFFVAVIIASVAMAACAQLNSEEIPAPYKSRIVELRTDSIAMERKCADLQKQIAEMQAQSTWDRRQIEITAGEALNSLGKSASQYTINVDTLKIEPSRNH